MPDNAPVTPDEIAAILKVWEGHKHFDGPMEAVKWFADNTPELLALVRRLVAECERLRAPASDLSDEKMQQLADGYFDAMGVIASTPAQHKAIHDYVQWIHKNNEDLLGEVARLMDKIEAEDAARQTMDLFTWAAVQNVEVDADGR